MHCIEGSNASDARRGPALLLRCNAIKARYDAIPMHALHQLHRFSKALLSFHFMFSSLILYANLAQHMWVRNETREWFYFLILPPSYSLLQVSLLFSLFCFSRLFTGRIEVEIISSRRRAHSWPDLSLKGNIVPSLIPSSFCWTRLSFRARYKRYITWSGKRWILGNCLFTVRLSLTWR